jgi:hypothetical protein
MVNDQLEMVCMGTAVIQFELLTRCLSGDPEKNMEKSLFRTVI